MKLRRAVRRGLSAASVVAAAAICAEGALPPGLDLAELDALQRAAAAKWQNSPLCQEAEIEEEAAFCGNEALGDFRERTGEKLLLIHEEVAIPWSSFEALGGLAGQQPWPYEAAGQQRSMAVPEDWTCDDLRQLALPRVPWSRRSPADGAAMVRDTVRSEGAVVLEGLQPDSELLDRAKAYLLRRAAEAGSTATEFVMKEQHRHHFRLHPSEDPLVAALYASLVRALGLALLPLVSSLGSLVEFAAMITNPGAEAQAFHKDMGASEEELPEGGGPQAPMYTLFLFLSDVEGAAEGPLQVIPGSHLPSETRDAAEEVFATFVDTQDEERCLGQWQACPLRRGDAVLYDNTGLHRGTANNSSKTRIVVYASVLGIGSVNAGPTFAIENSLLSPPRRLGDELAKMTGSHGAEL